MTTLVKIKDIKVGQIISYDYRGKYQVKTAHALVLDKQYEKENDEWKLTCQFGGEETGRFCYAGQKGEIYYNDGDIYIQDTIGYDDDRYDYFYRLCCNELTEKEIEQL